jgi:hypothetical protein
MQSNKASKKTRNSAEETVAAGPEISPKPEKAAKPRASRSSRAKKTETVEPVSANHHHKAAPSIAADETPAEASPKAFVVSAAAGSSFVEPAVEVTTAASPSSVPAEVTPVADGPVNEWAAAASAPSEVASVAEASPEEVANPIAQAPPREVTNEDIAQLAHSYWLARGCANGSSEEDWLRAERELKAQR